LAQQFYSRNLGHNVELRAVAVVGYSQSDIFNTGDGSVLS
jgi:hypothetical protein